MLFLSFNFSCFGLRWLLVVRSHFWPFIEVQNGNQREVTRRCRNFLKPKETKEGKSLFGSGDRKRAFVLFVAFCWPRNRIEGAIANTPGRVLPPQTEKQSAATQ
ncbi:MAG: hypothetical protein DME98_02865 [Verrucomicrobia bacterium]|nr:MAG: hypothetical protein DME98_02865 [Verrucomicrobiota bacterium]